MYLDAFDRRIIDVLSGSGGHMTLAELIKDSGFAHFCGQDLTKEISQAPHDEDVFSDIKKIGKLI